MPGLPNRDAKILSAIAALSTIAGPTTSQIGEAVGMTRGGALKRIRKLRERGLVEVSAANCISLTPAGRDAAIRGGGA